MPQSDHSCLSTAAAIASVNTLSGHQAGDISRTIISSPPPSPSHLAISTASQLVGPHVGFRGGPTPSECISSTNGHSQSNCDGLSSSGLISGFSANCSPANYLTGQAINHLNGYSNLPLQAHTQAFSLQHQQLNAHSQHNQQHQPSMLPHSLESQQHHQHPRQYQQQVTPFSSINLRFPSTSSIVYPASSSYGSNGRSSVSVYMPNTLTNDYQLPSVYSATNSDVPATSIHHSPTCTAPAGQTLPPSLIRSPVESESVSSQRLHAPMAISSTGSAILEQSKPSTASELLSLNPLHAVSEAKPGGYAASSAGQDSSEALHSTSPSDGYSTIRPVTLSDSANSTGFLLNSTPFKTTLETGIQHFQLQQPTIPNTRNVPASKSANPSSFCLLDRQDYYPASVSSPGSTKLTSFIGQCVASESSISGSVYSLGGESSEDHVSSYYDERVRSNPVETSRTVDTSDSIHPASSASDSYLANTRSLTGQVEARTYPNSLPIQASNPVALLSADNVNSTYTPNSNISAAAAAAAAVAAAANHLVYDRFSSLLHPASWSSWYQQHHQYHQQQVQLRKSGSHSEHKAGVENFTDFESTGFGFQTQTLQHQQPQTSSRVNSFQVPDEGEILPGTVLFRRTSRPECYADISGNLAASNSCEREAYRTYLEVAPTSKTNVDGQLARIEGSNESGHAYHNETLCCHVKTHCSVNSGGKDLLTRKKLEPKEDDHEANDAQEGESEEENQNEEMIEQSESVIELRDGDEMSLCGKRRRVLSDPYFKVFNANVTAKSSVNCEQDHIKVEKMGKKVICFIPFV
ncbi:unnamed protein product [Protopolystoma xenopodis]|uniref:Uncharacterized protein n=1 Tax=Protopolystoma xenopodis TaxID=117903 RepID=A0A448WNJ0_9PLAT|nr:unnamed protein product [Protopolystoma xenopodis]